LIKCKALLDRTICPIHDHLHRLGLEDGGLVDRLHQEYHRAIAAMDFQKISSPESEDWAALEEIEQALEQAILEEFRKAKESRDL
jgi:hypothetical protein